jgi:segregation and condensation protein B
VNLKQVIEALVFASPKPLQVAEIVDALRATGERAEVDGPEREYGATTAEQAETLLRELREDLAQAGRGYVLVEQVNGWILVTNPDAAPWVRRLYPEAKPTRLSGPALETLAIIAYRQPVTRADVEAVRGVAVDGVTQVLLDRGLVKISGRADMPGRPLLYSTTEFFLQHFGLKHVDELPNAGELKRIVLPTAPPPTEAEEKPKGKGKKGKGSEAEAAPEGSAEQGEQGALEPAAVAVPEEPAVEAVVETPAEAVETPASPEPVQEETPAPAPVDLDNPSSDSTN